MGWRHSRFIMIWFFLTIVKKTRLKTPQYDVLFNSKSVRVIKLLVWNIKPAMLRINNRVYRNTARCGGSGDTKTFIKYHSIDTVQLEWVLV